MWILFLKTNQFQSLRHHYLKIMFLSNLLILKSLNKVRQYQIDFNPIAINKLEAVNYDLKNNLRMFDLNLRNFKKAIIQVMIIKTKTHKINNNPGDDEKMAQLPRTHIKSEYWKINFYKTNRSTLEVDIVYSLICLVSLYYLKLN